MHDLQGTSLSLPWEILTEKLQLVEENEPVSNTFSVADQKNPYVSQECMVAIRKENIHNGKNTHITKQSKLHPV